MKTEHGVGLKTLWNGLQVFSTRMVVGFRINLVPQETRLGLGGYRNRTQKFMHHIMGLLYVYNPCPTLPGVPGFTCLDHKDNTPNNHKDNLRWVNHALNMLNKKGRCIVWCKRFKCWYPRVKCYGKNYHADEMGVKKTYKTEEEALSVAKKLKVHLFDRFYQKAIDDYNTLKEERIAGGLYRMPRFV